MTNPQYTSYPYRFVDKGLVQRYVIDQMPMNGYWNHGNAEARQENSLASRLGRIAITTDGTNNTPVPGNVNKLAVLQGLNATDYRYASVSGATAQIVRRQGPSHGAFTDVTTGIQVSGERILTASYRPSNTGTPYMFFGDFEAMLKDNGTFSVLQLWGIFAPLIPCTAAVDGTGNLDVTGGVNYDWRYTYFNQVTGNESGPSQVMIQANFAAPVAQAVNVTVTASTDPQVTNIRLYRRGGTLANQWLLVQQLPNKTQTYLDNSADSSIAAAEILNVDTAPPVTSTLPVQQNFGTHDGTPGNSTVTLTLESPVLGFFFVNQQVPVFTIDIGNGGISPLPAETVVIQAVDPIANTITAYFQGEYAFAQEILQPSTRTGQPVGIGTIAFDRAWLAGDQNNPNILYYSDRFNPESFPLENFLEIGVPSDPIVGVVEWNGQLYVFTQSTIWNILGAQGGTIPLPFKTAADHGLYAPDGWTITDSEIWFISAGGIYAFQGSTDVYVSEPIEWIFTAQFIDDTLPRTVPLMNPLKISDTVMAFYQNEVYVCYTGQDNLRHRVIYSKVYKRWRNDDVPANAIVLQDDTYELLFGTLDGMIYQDRIGNYDDDGFVAGIQQFAPIPVNIQTAALDMQMPKNFKNFNEFTVDIDTAGLPVTVTLVFDYGLTPVVLGTVTTSGRQQVEFNINNGDGQLSLNVSLLLTASVNSNISNPITVYEAHIRATPEAELRDSYDSYFSDFGSPDWKIVKQCWIEFVAPDPAGITFNCYIGGSATPAFTFSVPQSLKRTSQKVRFPATKGRIYRWVATSPSPFRLYSDSRFEWKAVTRDKSYQLRPLQQESGTQP